MQITTKMNIPCMLPRVTYKSSFNKTLDWTKRGVWEMTQMTQFILTQEQREEVAGEI